ncbi:MAG: rhodanese-like domain-containing protein, partial [Bacteroidetes bacterium]|nr:rhodanese-like domain-containing protein [Bacteroidota bacterium]
DEVLATGAVPLSPEQFEELVENQDALMLDTRNREEFAKEHIPNSIYIGLDGSFAPWVGALITDLKQPIVIIADEGKAEEVVTRLARVGYDNSLGYLEGGLEAWKKSGRETDSINTVTAEELLERKNQGDNGVIVDVRKPSEFISQHIKDAVNIPLDYINSNMNKMDRDETYYLHCKSGYRSLVMASILKARGFHNLTDITRGWEAILPSGLPVSEYVCPTTIPQEIMDEAVAKVV